MSGQVRKPYLPGIVIYPVMVFFIVDFDSTELPSIHPFNKELWQDTFAHTVVPFSISNSFLCKVFPSNAIGEAILSSVALPG